jgi:hypothetical protein
LIVGPVGYGANLVGGYTQSWLYNNSDDRDSRFLRNTHIYVPNYKALHSRT